MRHFFEKFCSKYRFICKILVCVTVREVNWLAKRYRPLFEYPQCTHAYVRKFFCSPIPVANWIEIFQKVSIGSNLNWNWSVPWISLRVYERLFLLTFHNFYPFAKFRIQFTNPFKCISKFSNVFFFIAVSSTRIRSNNWKILIVLKRKKTPKSKWIQIGWLLRFSS